MNIQISSEGRRHYLTGNTYPIKDQLRSAGAHWDRDRGAWWTSKRDVAESFLAAASAAPKAYEPAAGEELVAVDGNTYPVRDRLRELGGRWNAASKVWMVPASQTEAARAAVAAAPPKRARSGGIYAADKFNGYGRKRGGYVKRCVTGGNCSSFGSGRSCGGHDCDGY